MNSITAFTNALTEILSSIHYPKEKQQEFITQTLARVYTQTFLDITHSLSKEEKATIESELQKRSLEEMGNVFEKYLGNNILYKTLQKNIQSTLIRFVQSITHANEDQKAIFQKIVDDFKRFDTQKSS